MFYERYVDAFAEWRAAAFKRAAVRADQGLRLTLMVLKVIGLSTSSGN